MSRRKKGYALAKRYGHAAMAKVEEGISTVKRMASANPTATAAALGAGVAGAAAGMGVGPAMLLGGVGGVVVEKMTGK